MSEWKTYTLGKDAVTKLGDGLHGTPNYDDNGEYYFINGSNLVDGKIVINSNTKKVTEEEFIKYKKDLSDKTILLALLQPQFWLYWKFSPAQTSVLTTSIFLTISVPLWSFCFGWIFIRVKDWLNRFPVLGRKVF